MTDRSRTDATDLETAGRKWIGEHQCAENDFIGADTYVEIWHHEYDPGEWGYEWRLSADGIDLLINFCPFCGVTLDT